MIDSSMIPDFIVEAQEHLEELESSLLKLERSAGDPEIVNDIFRSMHTIKGAAQFVGIERVAELSHKLENLLELIRQGERELNQDIIDTLIEGKDRISLLVEELESFQEEKTEINDLLGRIQAHEESSPDDEIELTDDFKELFTTLDEEEEKEDFAENTEVIAALSEEKPEVEEQPSPSLPDRDKVVNEPDVLFDEPDEHDEKLATLSPPPAPEHKTAPAGLEDIHKKSPEKSSITSRSDIDLAPLREEIANEDFNDELFLIFIEQLQESISLLRNFTDSLPQSSNKSHVIGQCSDLISKLHSSANYMGYDRLARFYGQWIAELEMIDLQLSTGSEVSFDFMDSHIRKTTEIFPQVEDISADTALPIETYTITAPSSEAMRDKRPEESDEEKEPGDFRELFSTIDDTKDEDFDENSEVIAALSDEESDVDLHTKPSAPGLMDAPDGADFLFTEPEEETEDGEAEPPSPTSSPKKFVERPSRIVSAPARKEIDLPTLQKEVANEDFDDDLVLIFIEQLQENIFLLQKLTTDFPQSTNKSLIVEQCADLVSKLHSSANYMGYERLAEFYGQWIAGLEMIVLELSIGSKVSFDFMNDHIMKISKVFPQIKVAEIERTAPGKEETISSVEALYPDAEDDKTAEVADTKAPVVEEPEQVESQLEETIESDKADHEEETTDEEFALVKAAFTDTDVRRTKLLEKLSGEIEALDSEPEEPTVKMAEEKTLLALLQDEIQHDESDNDLVDIYIQQLHDSISTLCNLSEHFDQSDDKPEALKQCAIVIDALRSLSNYMDYEHFENFYRKWLGQVSTSEKELASGQPVAISYMAENIALVTQVFTQLSKIPNKTAGAEGIEEPDKDEHRDAVRDQATIDQPADDQQLFDKLSSVLNAEDERQPDDRLSDALEGDDNQLLFDKLSNALDTSSLEQTPTSLKPIDDVINEILTGTGLAQPTRQEMPEPGPAEETPMQPERRKVRTDRRQDIIDRRRGLVDRRLDDATSKVKQSIRVDADKIDFLMNQVGELVVNKSYISQLYHEINNVQKYYQGTGRLDKDELKPLQDYANKLNEINVSLGRVSSEMQDGVMNVRMMPVSHLFKRYPRLVRDLVHKTNKKVQLKILGEDTQLDKTVIEEVSDPLIHIIRNSIDHGIETVDERRRAGKDETATLRLEAYPDSNNIVIEITDDGRGIDPRLIKEKALEKNLLPAEELDTMSDEELTYLIMTPGFSTAEQTTRTSGRGVGMDVVRTNIERLNGSIEIKSLVDHETMIRVRIPLTLAIIQVLGIRLGSKVLSIPLTSVEETARIRMEDIDETDGFEIFRHRDAALPIMRLGEILNIPTEPTDHKHIYVVIVKAEGQRAGLIVDKFIGKDEAVVKPLADYLRQESGFSGATIKGDGTISLILDIPTLLSIVKERQQMPQQKQTLVQLLKGSDHA